MTAEESVRATARRDEADLGEVAGGGQDLAVLV